MGRARPGMFQSQQEDVLIMAAMVLVYLLVALHNLGSFKVPATVWQPLRKGESLVLDLGRVVPVSRIYYYCGINDKRFQQPSFSLDYETKAYSAPWPISKRMTAISGSSRTQVLRPPDCE